MGITTINYLSILFVFLFWSMLVFSQQSSTQKSIMLNLLQLIQDQQYYDGNYYPIQWNASTNPCTWDGVICTNNSVTQLHLFFSYGLPNSSFLSVACQIQSLEVLDVSYSHLYSIPDEFITICGKLPRLKSVNFCGNSIDGNLPSFNEGGFTSLRSLDLSDNSLNGSIGPKLDFGRLSSLNLSYNNLSGPIPTTMQKFGFDAFVGNSYLCGYPLNSCGVAGGGNDSSIQDEKRGKDSFYIGLYVSIGLGFYFGFWGVCGTLALKHSWRRAFFNFVDRACNRIYVTVLVCIAKFQRKFQT